MDESKPVNLNELTKAFPKDALQTRQGGGGKALTYIATHSVIHRLNDATDNRWDFRLTRFELIGDTYVAIGELTIPGLGTRTGIGVQKVAERSGEDLVKGCASDALKKAATCFGVGLELYGPDYEDEDFVPANGRQPPKQPTPLRPATTATSGGANLQAVHASAQGKVQGDPHQRAHALSEACFGVPSMRDLTPEQGDLVRKAFGECRSPQDGEALIVLAIRTNAATSTAELDDIAKDIGQSGFGPERLELMRRAFRRATEAIKLMAEVNGQQAMLAPTGTAGNDRHTH